MTRAGAAAAVVVAAAAALTQGAAHAADSTRQVLLRSTAAPLDSRAPLASDVTTPPDVLPGGARLTGNERVTVVVDSDGSPTTIRVRQRLSLEGTGDYSFVVGAPLADALPAPGTESVPGRRSGGIVWQGFVSGQRVLAADALLERRAAAALPIRLRLTTTVDGRPLRPGERRDGHVEVRLEVRNDTALRVDGFDADASPTRVAPVLDRIHAAAARGGVLPDQYLTIAGEPRRRSFVVDAPFHVSGRLRVPTSTLRNIRVEGGTVGREARGATARFEATLTGKTPATTVVFTADGSAVGAPSLELTARPVAIVPGLDSPGGGTWREAVAGGDVRDGRALVALASRAVLQLSRIQQFNELLSVPGPGDSAAVYRFLSHENARPARGTRSPDDGPGTSSVVLSFVAGAAALCGLAVIWARL